MKGKKWKRAHCTTNPKILNNRIEKASQKKINIFFFSINSKQKIEIKWNNPKLNVFYEFCSFYM